MMRVLESRGRRVRQQGRLFGRRFGPVLSGENGQIRARRVHRVAVGTRTIKCGFLVTYIDSLKPKTAGYTICDEHGLTLDVLPSRSKS